MSSSTHTVGAGGGDEGFDNTTSDKSFGFRRWSRNLSAQRHKELNRLNQIEQRRQILELKTQNDLFNQMSATVNGLDEAEKIPHKIVDNTTTTCSSQNKHSSIALNELVNTINQTESEDTTKTTTTTTKNARNKQQLTQATLNQQQSVLDEQSMNKRFDFSNEQQLTSVSSPEDDLRGDKGKGINLDQVQQQVASSALSITIDGMHAQDEQKQNNKKNLPLTNSSDERKKDFDHFVKRPITSEQLARFVSNRVPENKRVLCLIVRDKLSRLNKAKSYFYPTYYLFIQAIVDIDETTAPTTSGEQSSKNHQQQQNNTIERDDNLLNTQVDGDNHAVEIASNSADNSFSASSSISADMLFIGANGNGAILSSMKVLSGNSYSDNEIYAGTETEDDNLASSGKTGKLPNQVRVKSGHIMKSAGSLQGRDSPLVFPNRDNNNCDQSESGSLIGAWSTSKDTVNIPNDKRFIATPTAAAALCQSSNLKSGLVTSSARVNRMNGNCKGGPLKSLADESRLIKEGVVMKTAGELSIGDSKEDRDDMEDDDEEEEEEEEEEDDDDVEADSDNDELTGHKRWINDVNSSRNCNNEEVNHNTITRASLLATSINSDHENIQQNLFDNEKNPYTGTYGVLLAGRRRKKAKTYLIGLNEYGYTRKNSICKLKSNVLGTQFNAIRFLDGCIVQNHNDRFWRETNVLGFKGPRKMRVFLPKDPSKGSKNLTETFKKNSAAVIQLKNMTPSWNVESQSYVLNFHGRVTQASVKNFQLIENETDYLSEGGQNRVNLRDALTMNLPSLGYNDDFQNHEEEDSSNSNLSNKHPQQNRNNSDSKSHQSYDLKSEDGHMNATLLDSLTNNNNKALIQYNSSIVMQFGRISNHEFTCDVTYPLTILQAFTIALSSFDSKLACE